MINFFGVNFNDKILVASVYEVVQFSSTIFFSCMFLNYMLGFSLDNKSC